MDIARRRRWARRGILTLATICVAAGVLLTASVCAPAGGWATQYGRAGVRLSGGTLEGAWCTHDVQWARNSWLMSTTGSQARVIMVSSSAWRPNTGEATMLLAGGATGNTRITLRTLYVPLWPWIVLPIAGAAVLWWRSPRPIAPGCCGQCGYDLRGVRGGTCPECGVAGSAAFRIISAIGRALSPARFIPFS